MTELVKALPHGSLVTVQSNPYVVLEHPIIRCVLCVNVLWVVLWKYTPPNLNLTSIRVMIRIKVMVRVILGLALY